MFRLMWVHWNMAIHTQKKKKIKRWPPFKERKGNLIWRSAHDSRLLVRAPAIFVSVAVVVAVLVAVPPGGSPAGRARAVPGLREGAQQLQPRQEALHAGARPEECRRQARMPRVRVDHRSGDLPKGPPEEDAQHLPELGQGGLVKKVAAEQ